MAKNILNLKSPVMFPFKDRIWDENPENDEKLWAAAGLKNDDLFTHVKNSQYARSCKFYLSWRNRGFLFNIENDRTNQSKQFKSSSTKTGSDPVYFWLMFAFLRQ